MKVLYAIPAFLEYRLPYFKELNRLFDGNFHILYSFQRYRILNKVQFFNRIKEEMHDNAHPIYTDYLFDTNSMSFNMKNIEKGKHIPFTFGLIRKIRSIKPDLIITEGFFQWTPLIILYSLIFKTPIFMGYERTCHTERYTGKLKILHRKITDKFIKGYLVNGEETKKYLLSIGVNEEKIHIGGMSADSKLLSSRVAEYDIEEKKLFRKQFLKNRKGLIYLFSGNLCERKGINFLLEVWGNHKSHFKEDILIIIGKGDLYSELYNKYSNDESIFFEGFIDYDYIYKYYAISDVFILPTIEDNWSLVIPEAMACGLPVATSIYNGCHNELIKKGINGTIFDTYKQKSLLKALEYFHNVDLKSQGANSIILEKEFNTENCALRTFKALTNEK